MKLIGILREAESRLSKAGVENARRDVQIMMAHVLGCEPARLVLTTDEAISEDDARKFHLMITARSDRQPVSQIIGYREFWGRQFIVSSDVLDPRPDTELIVEEALKGPPARTFLDLCTGSGNLAISLLCEWSESIAVATDISLPALEVAQKNAVRHKVENRLELRNSSWLAGMDQKFDLLISNPPYIAEDEIPDLSEEVRKWEPDVALTPGGDGLIGYRLIAAGLEDVLTPGGRAIVEFGSKQAKAVKAIFHAEGYSDTQIHRDLGGNERIIVVKSKF